MIVKYRLKYEGGSGHQPYSVIRSYDCNFEGGNYEYQGYYIGYLTGDRASEALSACSADFGMVELTEEEACEHADLSSPPGREVQDTTSNGVKYVHPAVINTNGRAVQNLEDLAPTNSEVNLLRYYKKQKLLQLQNTRLNIQKQGFTTTNNIKLQVEEYDLIRWTQLTSTILAFQPATVNIIDYDNNIHNLTKDQALQMLAEVAVWGQNFIVENRQLKDAILACTSIEELNNV